MGGKNIRFYSRFNKVFLGKAILSIGLTQKLQCFFLSKVCALSSDTEEGGRHIGKGNEVSIAS